MPVKYELATPKREEKERCAKALTKLLSPEQKRLLTNHEGWNNLLREIDIATLALVEESKTPEFQDLFKNNEARKGLMRLMALLLLVSRRELMARVVLEGRIKYALRALVPVDPHARRR